MFLTRIPDSQWSAGLVEQFPRSWQKCLLDAYCSVHPGDKPDGDNIVNNALTFKANTSLRLKVEKLTDAGAVGLRPDAGDADICDVAANTARDFARRLNLVEIVANAHKGLQRFGKRFLERCKWFAVRAMLARRGILDVAPKSKERAPKLARIVCERFWRRKLRAIHARTVEAVAIDLELVHRNKGLYVSDDALARRVGQLVRNQRALENTVAINEYGQDYTLADLAAKGTANKAIRRAELMTRIAGFELIAKSHQHGAMMITTTCPSRMHKMRSQGKGGAVVANGKYDGTTPREAQQYKSLQWQRMRAAAAKEGVKFYGFRIAEPQQDGTPHWHTLLFYSQHDAQRIQALALEYFLENDNPNEAGAHAHRVSFEVIDWARGSAAGYIAKYVSKNIDGYQVDKDLYGNDTLTSSRRVDAWSASWGIRQFQQVGGPPVGVWRELRRLNPENVGEHAPQTVHGCVSAMNLQKTEPGLASAAWKTYTTTQGGVFTPRKDLKVTLYKEDDGDLGRYGDLLGDKVRGISCAGVNLYSPGGMAGAMGLKLSRPSFETIESERCAWQITTREKTAQVVQDLERAAYMQAFSRAAGSRAAQSAAPWSPVNNCNSVGVAPRYTEKGETIKEGHFDWRGRFVPTLVHSGGAIHTHRSKVGYKHAVPS